MCIARGDGKLAKPSKDPSRARSSLVPMAAPLSVPLLVLTANGAYAQGQPVDLGSHIPVALWAIGTCLLGLAIAYGIMRNRKRSKTEKRLTEAATRANYAAEERSRQK